MSRKTTAKKIPLRLALQGGGAHGAFQWGFIERLLEETDIEIEAVAGSSIGSINSTLLAAGLTQGGGGQAGKDKAKEMLRIFWQSMGQPGTHLVGRLPKRTQKAASLMTAFVSMSIQNWASILLTREKAYKLLYKRNEDTMNKLVDFEALRQSKIVELYVTAVDVETGAVKDFTGAELSPDAVQASCAVPGIFKPPVINGRQYIDGGFAANPSLYTLVPKDGRDADILLVQLSPQTGAQTTGPVSEVRRSAEIVMNASAIAEARGIEMANAYRQQLGQKPIRLHIQQAGDALRKYTVLTMLNFDASMIEQLHQDGRKEAEKFLAAHKADLGQRSSFTTSQLDAAPSLLPTAPLVPALPAARAGRVRAAKTGPR